jgi:pilus assembly protein CpaB
MNLKQSIPLVAAIGLGLVAAKVAHDISAKKSATADIKTVAVVIAKGPIGPGTPLTPELLDVTRIPGETMPAGTAASVDSLLGRVTLAPLFDGQPVRSDYLAPKGSPAGLASLVPAGMRAVTVDVNETSSVAGLITPGSHVDLVSCLGVDNDHMVSRTVAQDIFVVAVGQRLSAQRAEGEKDSGYRSITLLATPHNAELISLASNTSRCRLILRGAGDKTRSDSEGVSYVELRGHGSAEETPAAVVNTSLTGPATQPVSIPQFSASHPHHVTELIRAGAVSNVDFQLPAPTTSNTMTDTNPNTPAVPNSFPN